MKNFFIFPSFFLHISFLFLHIFFIFLNTLGIWKNSEIYISPPLYRSWNSRKFQASSSFEYSLLATHQAKQGLTLLSPPYRLSPTGGKSRIHEYTDNVTFGNSLMIRRKNRKTLNMILVFWLG